MKVWKDIAGFEGLYQISINGDVKSLARMRSDGRPCKERILKVCIQPNGYANVCLHKDGAQYHKLIHRLVAEAFLPNPEGLPQVNHRDECKQNNHKDNLEWCSAKYNLSYGTRGKRLRVVAAKRRMQKGERVGVRFRPDRNCYEARIYINGKCVHLGQYDTEAEACAARIGAEEVFAYMEGGARQ